MHQSRRNLCACLILVWVLAACSSNPAKQKAAYLASGVKYAKAARYQEAVIQFRNAIEIDPRFAQGHHQLANVYLKLKSYQLAYRELQTTVDLDPGNTDAQLQLVLLLLEVRRFDDAETAAKKVLAVDPRNAGAHTLLGEKHAVLKAWPSAIREFQTAIELDPAKVENYAGLGLAYASTGRTSDAEATLQKATEVQPKSAEALMNLGRFYFAQHRPAEAEAAMRAASEADPHALLPLILLAKIYMEGGKLTEAEQLCVELKRRAPDDPDGYGALASFYEATGQKVRAAAELQSLLTAKPKDAAIKARLTDVLLDLNRIEEASRLNQELLRASPGDPRALFSKGRIQIGQQKYAEAKATLEQAAHSDPQSAASHYFLGLAESSLGQPELAGASFARALDLAPGMTDAAVALADLNARKGDYDNALRLANQALEKISDLPFAHVVAAKALMGKGNAALAEGHLRSALDRDPAFLPALEALLEIQASQGRGQDAVWRLSALVSQHPRDAKLHFLFAAAQFKQNDLDKSEASVKQAIAIDPKTPDAYGLLGEISRARGALQQAATWYQKAVAENPAKVENLMALSGLYEKLENWEEAKRAAERAHSLDPKSPFIANNLAYLYLEHGGDVNMALSLAQQAKQKLADSPIVSDTVGWAYYKLRLPDAAVTQLSESVRKDPTNPMYRYHLGMAYVAAGRLSDGASSLRLALSSADFPHAASAKMALNQLPKGIR